MKELALDVVIIWVSFAIGMFALYHWLPTLMLIAVIFFVTGVVWLVMDMAYAIREASRRIE